MSKQETNSVDNWEDKLNAILFGIDKDDGEIDGWWETSTGVNFGTKKLKEVKDFISKTIKQAKAETIELCVKKIDEHHRQNTYEEIEQLVYHTTINEIITLLSTLKSIEK